MKDFFDPKVVKTVSIVTLCVIGLFLSFGLGVFVGLEKADFSFQWADMYHHNFGGPKEGFFGDMMNLQKDFTNPNGGYGTVIKTDTNSITIKDQDNTEKTFLVDANTNIICQKTSFKVSDLKTGDSIIVIGEPNGSGDITATLVRLLPPCPAY